MTIEIQFTELELAIMQGLADGMGDQQIVDANPGYTLNTLRTRKSHLMGRVNALTAAHLVAFGFRNGLIK